MQAEGLHFFVSVQKRVCFSAFKRQRSWIACLLPQGCLKGLAGQEKIILAALRYFFLPGLAQKGNQEAGGYKIGKTYPDGIIHS